MRFYSFGGVSFPTAYQDQDMPVGARSGLVEVPGGAFDEDGAEVTLKSSVLQYSFPLDTAPDTALDTLFSKLVGGRRLVKTVQRDGTTFRQTFAKLLSAQRGRSPHDKLIQQVDLTLTQDYPYWMATADEPLYLDHGQILDNGLVLDGHIDTATINASSVTLTITNAGGVPVRRGQLVIIPASGATITNLTITNAANMMQLRYSGSVTYPQYLVLDLLSKSAKRDAVSGYANIYTPAGQMDWMQLEVGTNALTLEVSGRTGNTTFEYHWSRHWV